MPGLIEAIAEDITIRGKRSYAVDYGIPGPDYVKNNYSARYVEPTIAAIITDVATGRHFLVKVEEVDRKQ